MSDFAAFSFDDSLNGTLATVGSDGSVRMAEMNLGITPLFFVEELEDSAATEKAGTLRMREFERVRIHTAGDMNNAPVHPVTRELIERFPEAYARWKTSRTNDHIEGTSLAAWPIASKGFVQEMKALNIRSVEDLSVVSDGNIAKILNGREWREKAKAWLATNKDATSAMKYAAENERLREDVEDLRAQVTALAARITAEEGSEEAPRRQHRKANAA
jgi:hypothetical protein